MQTQQHRHGHSGCENQGPEWFYGYCHDTGRMRMMNYPDYMTNMQTAYSNLLSGSNTMTQQFADMMQGRYGTSSHRSGCGCHDHPHHRDCDDGCSCCIRCADAVEYARCGELRQIPITFENDTRRERNVTLTLSSFATDAGKEPGWKAALSESSFTLPACGEKTVTLTVAVQCGDPNATGTPGTTDTRPPEGQTAGQVDRCQVAYATLRAEGCRVRPLVIAVAVLPNHCGAHHAGCLCGCC